MLSPMSVQYIDATKIPSIFLTAVLPLGYQQYRCSSVSRNLKTEAIEQKNRVRLAVLCYSYFKAGRV